MYNSNGEEIMRVVSYENLTLEDLEILSRVYIFICDGDTKKLLIKEKYNE